MLQFRTSQEQLIYGYVALIVAPSGTLDKGTVRHFQNQLLDYLKVGYHFLILDCSAIKSVNSTGLQVLLEIVETYQQAGGIILLIKVLPQISKFFDMVGFTPIFTSLTSKAEAIDYLKKQIDQATAEAKSEPPLTSEVVESDVVFPAEPAIQSQQSEMPDSQAYLSQFHISSQIVPQHTGAVSARALSQNSSELQVEMTVSYNRRMYGFDVVPFRVRFVAIAQKGRSEDQVINIVPYFPGCLVVPDYRAFFLKQNCNITFWVTPLVRKKIQGWLEVWRGEGSAHQFHLFFEIGSQRIFIVLLLLATITFVVFLFPPVASYLSGLALLRHLTAILQRPQNVGLVLTGILLIFSLAAYLKNKPLTANSVPQKIVFKGN